MKFKLIKEIKFEFECRSQREENRASLLYHLLEDTQPQHTKRRSIFQPMKTNTSQDIHTNLINCQVFIIFKSKLVIKVFVIAKKHLNEIKRGTLVKKKAILC